MGSYIQNIFSERIGGKNYGKGTQIYKFEKIRRAKVLAIETNPGKEVIDMGSGEPDDMAFPSVVEKLNLESKSWENRSYTDNGIEDFKMAAAEYMKEAYNVEIDPKTEINHAIGCKSALTLIPAAFINPEDIVLLTSPGYPILGTWTKYLGGEVVNLPLKPENSFLPDFTILSQEQRKRAKLLYLNYPNNPTGAIATVDFYKKAIKFAKENNLLIISDVAYAPLTYREEPLSILSIDGAKECSIEIHSMSKGFNMVGWRMAWICGNPLAVHAFAAVKDNSDSGQFAAIQKASIQALKEWKNITPVIKEKYIRRLEKMVKILSSVGFSIKMPHGGFYLYTKIPKAIKNGITFSTGEEFSQWLIKEKLIVTVPWDDVGNYVRFSATFVARDGKENEERVLKEFEKRLTSTQFIFS